MSKAIYEMEIGIPKSAKLRSAEVLSKVLSETYILFLKTQHCHWNVTGPLFISLHLMFEDQYREMIDAIDEVAERIRSLGEYVPTNFLNLSEYVKAEENKGLIDYQGMICDLSVATQLMIAHLRQGVNEVQSGEDSATHDLLSRRLVTHEKNLWMLQSFLVV